jgi:exopolyphosphatase/guanosine-5'-triphosphate,3'-diphosphate pyrophosphatase
LNSQDTIAVPPGPNEASGSVGAIDMGSKNFKFVFGQKVNGVITTKLIGKERLELGKEVTENDGLIGDKKILQIQAALSRFVRYCTDRGAQEVLAIATSAIRNAKNHERIVDMARETGLTIDVVDGAREGEVGYFAATGGASNKLVSDAGSKSMQIAWESVGKIHSRSVPVGYELAYESFLEPARTLNEAEQRFRRFLDGNFTEVPENKDQFVALAANTITSFVTGEQKRQPHRTLAKTALNGRLSELRRLSESQYDDLKSSLTGAEKVLPGLIFLDYMMERSGHDEALVSQNELPVGLIVEYFLRRL